MAGWATMPAGQVTLCAMPTPLLPPRPAPPRLLPQVCWCHVHFDEAFSSLREPGFKSFVRLHLRPDGHLELFTLALDEVPSRWGAGGGGRRGRGRAGEGGRGGEGAARWYRNRSCRSRYIRCVPSGRIDSVVCQLFKAQSAMLTPAAWCWCAGDFRWQEDARWRGPQGGGCPGVAAHEAAFPSRWGLGRGAGGREARQ